MDLSKDSLKFLAEQAVQAARQDTITVEGDRKGVFYLRQPDGSLDRRVIDPMLQCEARDLPAIMNWLQSASAVPQVWFSRSLIEGVRDGYSGFDNIRLQINLTPQLRRLNSLTGTKFDQAGFIRLLRIELYGVVPHDFISAVRKVIFQHKVNSEATVNPGKASLGKQIETQLQGERELPESIRLNVQLFEEFGIRTNVECAVEIDLNEQRFSLTPFPLEIERALQQGEEIIRSMIEKAAADACLADLRVFYGSFGHSLGS